MSTKSHSNSQALQAPVKAHWTSRQHDTMMVLPLGRPSILKNASLLIQKTKAEGVETQTVQGAAVQAKTRAAWQSVWLWSRNPTRPGHGCVRRYFSGGSDGVPVSPGAQLWCQDLRGPCCPLDEYSLPLYSKYKHAPRSTEAVRIAVLAETSDHRNLTPSKREWCECWERTLGTRIIMCTPVLSSGPFPHWHLSGSNHGCVHFSTTLQSGKSTQHVAAL